MQFHPNFIFRSPLSSTLKSIDSSVFLEALYLSTPSFYEEHQKHLHDPVKDLKDLKKINISLYKYESRASHRSTPFGLFAGLSIGEWDNTNNIIIDSDLTHTINRKTRLDMNVLCSLAQELAKHTFIKPYLQFSPNTSIYSIGNSYRYIEYYYSGNKRFHKINRVDITPYLENILKESKTKLTQEELTHLLINDDIDNEEASAFIDELISSQLLVHQLEPTVTGIDYFDTLLKELKNILSKNDNSELKKIITLLISVDKMIKSNDTAIFNSIDSYKDIHKQLKIILPELSETNLFQTDLYKNTIERKLNSNLQDQLKNAIQFLNKINPPYKPNNLKEFAKRFREYYEDNEIPLLVALDTETGVGYPFKDNNGVNDLVEDVSAIREATNDSELKWNMLQAHLLKLIIDNKNEKKKIIEISEKDFNTIDFSSETLPDTFPIMFKVINATTNKIYLGNIGGSSAINLLGRFAGGNGELGEIVNTIAQFEQNQQSDKIIAEIVHLPESRTGNVLARPSFRKYEIPYLAKSSVDDVFQIKMEDLILKVKGDNIILFDKRLQQEIAPRLGNAHNYSFNSLPVYHFLADLQTHYISKPYLKFNWGTLSNQFDFLPRVEYQNTVLSPAKWQLNKNDLQFLQDKKKSDKEKQMLFFELKKRIELPDKFIIAEGDNELMIDVANPVAIDTFIDAVKNKEDVLLEEYLFDDEHALIRDNNGNSYTNECIAIIMNEDSSKKQKKSNVIAQTAKTIKSKQSFSIGSEWLYYKIYCGAKTADFILTEKIKQITENLLSQKIIDQWFFIRYSDPDVHLRFRIHIIDFKRYGEVLQLIHEEFEPLLKQHVISKIQTDTYKRELERYGDNSIELAEQLFYNDSVFVTDMLSMLDSESGGSIRWQIAIRSIDAFLDDFKLDLEKKYDLINMLSATFFQEHGGKKELKVALDTKFRNLRSQIESVLNRNNEEEKEYYPIIQLIMNRSRMNEPAVNEILLRHNNNELEVNLDELLSSLLHMNLDRLFMGRNRTNEFVVYDMLFKYYKGVVARSKSEKKLQTSVI